tara:strand:+ start:971 stop:1402 length:432 start_codon:yes stop_codon:yes gene_type:complete
MRTFKELAEAILALPPEVQEQEALFIEPYEDHTCHDNITLNQATKDLMQEDAGDHLDHYFKVRVDFLSGSETMASETYTFHIRAKGTDDSQKVQVRAYRKAFALSEDSKYYDRRVPDLGRRPVIVEHDTNWALYIPKGGWFLA